jgi:hypothetical protein
MIPPGGSIPDGIVSFKLVDSYGVPVVRAPVVFSARAGAIQSAGSVTDRYGIAAAVPVLGPQAGSVTFTATASGMRTMFLGCARPHGRLPPDDCRCHFVPGDESRYRPPCDRPRVREFRRPVGRHYSNGNVANVAACRLCSNHIQRSRGHGTRRERRQTTSRQPARLPHFRPVDWHAHVCRSAP